MHTVDVSLGQRSYSILIGEKSMDDLGRECQKLSLAPRCAIITDTNVARRYAKTAQRALRDAEFEAVMVTVPAGEKSKSLRVVQSCCDQLAGHRLDRKSFVVALGGG